MKKLFTIFTATLLLTALVVSCGKETQSSTQGGGICKIRYTITPPLQPGIRLGIYYNSFAPYSLNTGWLGTTQTQPLSTTETQEFSVTKGQNVGVGASLQNLYDLVCRQVKVDFLIDNSVKKTVILEMGYSKYDTSDPNNPVLYCKDGVQASLNFIVP